MNEITVLRGGAIGDFVLTLPAITALRLAYPATRLRLIGHPPILRLAHPELIVDQDSRLLTPLYTEGNIPPKTAALFARSKLVLAYLTDSYRQLAANLRTLSKGPLLIHDPHPPTGAKIHMTRHLLQPLYQQNIPVSHCTPRIELWPADQTYAQTCWQQYNLRPPTVIVHPGSGGRHKCWPVENYLKLSERLQQCGVAVIVLHGPAEEDLKGRLPNHLPILSPPSLLELAGLVARAELFIGNDSGPSHIAAAVGTPTLTIYGPTDPERWSPTGPTSHILSAPAGQLSALTLDRVWETASEILQQGSGNA